MTATARPANNAECRKLLADRHGLTVGERRLGLSVAVSEIAAGNHARAEDAKQVGGDGGLRDLFRLTIVALEYDL